MSSPMKIQSKMIMRSGREVNYDSQRKIAPTNHQDDLDEDVAEFLDAEVGSQTGGKAGSVAGSRHGGTSIRSGSSSKSKVSLRIQREARKKAIEEQQKAEQALMKMQEQELEMEAESRRRQFQMEEDMRKKKFEFEKKKIEMQLRHSNRKIQQDALNEIDLREEENDANSEGSDIQKLKDADDELEYENGSRHIDDVIQVRRSSSFHVIGEPTSRSEDDGGARRSSSVQGIGNLISSSSKEDAMEVKKSSRSNVIGIETDKSSSSRSNVVDIEMNKSSRLNDNDINYEKSSRHDAAFGRKKSLIREPDVRLSNQNDPERMDDPFNKIGMAIAKAVETGMSAATSQLNSSSGRFISRQLVGDRDLPTFWGEPETWINFHRQLIKSTELCGYTEEDNILRLQKFLRGKAKEAVESLLITSCSFDEIVQTLQTRFGRPQMIMKSLIEKARSVPAPTEGQMESLLDFSIAVRNLCATAESLKFQEYLSNPQILEEFVRKLPTNLKLDWGRFVIERTSGKPDLKDLSNYLSRLAEAASVVGDLNTFNHKRHGSDRDKRDGDRHRKPHFAMAVKEEKCLMGCSHNHELKSCKKFKSLDVRERWDLVKKNGLCFSCLEKGHQTKDCGKSKKCGINECQSNHQELLHKEYRKKPWEERNQWNDKKPWEEKRQEKEKSRMDHFLGAVQNPMENTESLSSGGTWMRVIPVILRNGDRQVKVNAFLDDGSELTLMDDELANELKLEGVPDSLNLGWIDGANSKDKSSRKVNLEIAAAGAGSRWYSLKNVRTKSNLALPLQALQQYKFWKKWRHLRNIPASQALGSKPRILIGQDNIHLTIPREIREGRWNEPVASLTKLGWVVHGRSSDRKSGTSFMCAAFNNTKDEELHQLVKEQFRLETLGIKVVENLPRSKDDTRADKMMEEKSFRDESGRWVVPMLWKTDEIKLPQSRGAAMRRLMITEKEMNKDPVIDELYCGKINEYIEKGFCRKLSPAEAKIEDDRIWYLPHFGRRNPNKPAKLRLVFDCAARTNGMGLNDALLQGPDLMIPLLTVLTKFRQREIAFAGDIRDMFHMVKIRQEDLPSLRFLWRGKNRDPKTPTDVYTMNVMVFGAVSSPYQAHWAKNRNAEDFRDEFPEAAKAIQKNHYVDDYLDSTRTVAEAIKLISEVKEVHRRGGFEIRGWVCNSIDVLKAVAPEEITNNESLELVPEDKLERVLGIYWDPKTDFFKFKKRFRNVPPVVLEGKRMPTKRELLSLVACLFDPLGFVAHLTVKAKILLQDIWRVGVGWDDPMPSQFEDKWRNLLGQLNMIEMVKIPRCYAPDVSSADELQLHVFCDASSQAYCAVGYLRATWRGNGEERSTTIIIMAKSRVAPVRLSSIPRLELNAALIGSRLVSQIKEDLDLKINETYLWTDSMTTLCWIKSDDPRKFKVYVACRVGEILDRTESCSWRYVPTKENPADEGTRDVVAANLSPESVWFHGPTFLGKSPETWPRDKMKTDDVKLDDLEMKKDPLCLMILLKVDVMEASRYSSWWRLIRVTAWIKRFVNNFSAKFGRNTISKSGPLKVSEVQEAEYFWVKKVQVESYANEYSALVDGKPVDKESSLLSLSPVMLNGMMRVKSRLEFASGLKECTKFPVILSSKHPYTILLMNEFHVRGGHIGLELVCNEIRQKYWIPGLRNAMKKVWKMCNYCNLEKAKQVVPVMAPLPEVRVSRGIRAFTHVGVDYFGPIDVKVLRRSVKRYGVLFTCLKTRAIHLEVAHSLSTDSMIMALERFICRRGEPEEMWSDNGTNFKGADAELKKCLQEIDQELVENKMTRRGIQWNFIPPLAPHFGGAWERLVRSVKAALGPVLRDDKLSDEVLLTVMAEAEASVNSRPLTHVSIDKDDEAALTPNCFLMGTTSVKQPPGLFTKEDISLRKQWRIAQVKADHFWNRWVSEYLPSLSLRTKWNKDVPDIKLGDLVFLVDSNLPRNNWLRGRVVKLKFGKDGHVRVVEVKTAKGSYRRAVTKLCRIMLSDTPTSCHLEGYVGDT